MNTVWEFISKLFGNHVGLRMAGAYSDFLYMIEPIRDWPVVLAFLVAGLAVRAAIVGKRRATPACARCGYDLAGLPQFTCPECGYKHRGEQHVLRERRWRYAVAGLATIVLGCWLRVAVDIEHRGWIGAVPSLFLVLAITPDPDRLVDNGVPNKNGWEWELVMRLSDSERTWETSGCGMSPGFYPQPTMPTWVRHIWMDRLVNAINSQMPDNMPPGAVARAYRIDYGTARRFLDVRQDDLSYVLADSLAMDVDPDAWLQNGGEPGVIRAIGTHLLVITDAAHHAKVARWLEDLAVGHLSANLRRCLITSPPGG